MKAPRFSLMDSRLAASAFRSVWSFSLLLLGVILGFKPVSLPEPEQMLEWQAQAGNPYVEIHYEEVPVPPVPYEPVPPPVPTPWDDQPPQ